MRRVSPRRYIALHTSQQGARSASLHGRNMDDKHERRKWNLIARDLSRLHRRKSSRKRKKEREREKKMRRHRNAMRRKSRVNASRADRFAIQSDFATSRTYVTTNRTDEETGRTRGEREVLKGAVLRLSSAQWVDFFYSEEGGYLRPRSRLYWPPYLLRFAASSVISGIQLANTAYTPTIIRCRQNRPLALIVVFFFLLFFFFFSFVSSCRAFSPFFRREAPRERR